MTILTPDQQLATPTVEANIYPEDIGKIFLDFDSVLDGSIDPHAVGLVHEAPGLLNGMADLTYGQLRVDSWNSKGEVEEKEIVKFKTMYDLTEAGLLLEDLLREADELSTKQISEWRVIWPGIRKRSLDELPQLAINVMGMMPNLYPNRLNMQLVGAARPPLKHEIIYRGDNSNDKFGKALERAANLEGRSRQEMYEWLSNAYVPGLITPATAQGNRQLSTEEGYAAWINGIVEYARIQEMPSVKRAKMYGRIILATTKHVISQTDAV